MNLLPVIVYIDGRNFEIGMSKNMWRKYFWLNLVQFFDSFLDHEKYFLKKVKYFTSFSKNEKAAERHSFYISANMIDSKFAYILGFYSPKIYDCNFCKSEISGYQEKQTDMNIGTHLISDCLDNECEMSIVVSGDSDLVPAINFVRKLRAKNSKKHPIHVIFPPKRYGYHLKVVSDEFIDLELHERRFTQHQFPRTLQVNESKVIFRPSNAWY